MTNRDALAWVTPGPGRVEFDPHGFVRGTGTLYSLSKEGKGSAGALVAGLTVAVTEAAEELAKRSPGGRLGVPLVAELASLPNGRAIVLAAGAPPALVRTLPWMTGPRAAEVRLSLREYDPSAASTLADAEAALADVRAAEPLTEGGRA